jgi:hypothetical protein
MSWDTFCKFVSLNPVHGEMYSIQHYVIKLVSDLGQVCGFLRVLQFPPPIKLTATIQYRKGHTVINHRDSGHV